MTSREKLLRKPIYWFDQAQNEIFRQVADYMEREQLNRTELAKNLNVSKGYITQLLNGDFNYSLKKLIELGMKIGVVPQISYKDINEVINDDHKSKEKFTAFYHYDNVVPFTFVKEQDEGSQKTLKVPAHQSNLYFSINSSLNEQEVA